MENFTSRYRSECLRKSYELMAKGEEPLWMCPKYYWIFYGSLLFKAKSYAEFAMLAVINGLVNPDSTRRYDETLELINRYEPYENFIFEEACSHRGAGKMNNKARKFRTEMIELERKS